MLNSVFLRPKNLHRTISTVFLLCLGNVAAWAETTPVSRKPPKVYEEHLKPLLSTWESIAERVAKAPRQDAEVILEDWAREELIWVEEAGARIITVRHDVTKALKAEGAKLIAEKEMSFSAKEEHMHLALARSTKDGRTFKDVAEEGVFIKRPEARDVGGAMHTDEETLTVVFPDVAEGSIVESISVHEDHGPDIPGHFMRNVMWANMPMIHLRRLVVIVPAAMEKELHWKGAGMVAMVPARRDLPNGKVLLEWISEGLPPLLLEDRGPPPSQTGPALRLSTLPGWEALGRWYADMMRETGDVSAEQAEEAAAKTQDAKDAREKAARLYDHVSQEVRYTGLEFGRGRYQPRPPALVEETRYGDCKDKANLLRVLLQKEGIESRMALLDTRHAGIIDHSIASPGRFNHAILAVTLPGEDEPVFCDPTQDGAPFGMLAVSDTDREALVISMDGGIEWQRTPRQVIVRHAAEADLTPEPGGGVSGWVRVRMDGVFAQVTRHQWGRQAFEGHNDVAKGMVGGLQGHEVIDFTDVFPVSAAQAKEKAAAFQLAVYVVKPGAAITQAEASERLNFPYLGALLPGVGRQAQRHTPITGTPMDMKVGGGYRIPKGWKVLDLPAPFKREAAGCTMQASWKEQKDRLLCECSMTTTQTLITAAEHPALWQARRDFAEWLSQPALLKRPGIAHPDKDAEDADEPRLWRPAPASLPKMPHSRGQVALLDKRFPLDPQNPLDGDHEARRVAAQKLLKDFPKDTLAKFEGELRLIWSDALIHFDFDHIEERIKPLLVDPSGDLTLEQIARGRIMMAAALAEAEKMPEALALALPNYENERIPLLIRQVSAGVAALALEKDEPARAVEMGRVALTAKGIPPITLNPILEAVFSSLARLPDSTAAKLQAEMQQVFTSHASEADVLRETLLEMPEGMAARGHLEAAEKLSEGLHLSIQEGGWQEDAKDTLKYTRELLVDARAFAPVHQQLVAWLKDHPWPDADKIEKGDKIEDAATSQEIAGDYYDKEAIRLRYLLRALTHYGPQANGGELVEEAAQCAHYGLAEEPKPPQQTEALIDELIRLWAAVPGDEDAAWDSEIFRGHVIERRARSAKAIEHFREMLARAGKEVNRQIDAQRQIFRCYERARNFPQMLVELQKMQQWPGHDDAALEALTAAHLAVALNNRAAAWSSYEWFLSRPDDEMPRWLSSPKEAVKKMLADRPATEKWWGRTSLWWREWEVLAKKDGMIAPYGGHTIADSPDVKAEEVAKDADEALLEKDKRSMSQLIHRTIHGARIYPHMAEAAASLLRNQAAKAYPQFRSNFHKLADKIVP